jgi:hypothetical protein
LCRNIEDEIGHFYFIKISQKTAVCTAGVQRLLALFWNTLKHFTVLALSNRDITCTGMRKKY